MKKLILMGIALIATVSFISCGTSKEASWKAAYEKAKNQELYTQDDSEPVEVAPVTPKEETQSYTSIRQRKASTTTTTTTTAKSSSNEIRQERLDVVGGGNIKAYNVVAGSFKSVDNANKRRNELVEKGYSAQLAKNPDTGMYRVIASSHDTKEAATSSRDKLRSIYKDAWLLYRTY